MTYKSMSYCLLTTLLCQQHQHHAPEFTRANCVVEIVQALQLPKCPAHLREMPSESALVLWLDSWILIAIISRTTRVTTVFKSQSKHHAPSLLTGKPGRVGGVCIQHCPMTTETRGLGGSGLKCFVGGTSFKSVSYRLPPSNFYHSILVL